MESLHQLEVIIMLLAVVLALTTIAQKIRIPYPIFLVLGGLALGLVLATSVVGQSSKPHGLTRAPTAGRFAPCRFVSLTHNPPMRRSLLIWSVSCCRRS